ncbi:hypothetical protein [Synechococcus sp. CS-1328]|uniref:hypothetical protein n=1 Tax=Synechococcus sp. CS-1328 TaxID=2847976 RepID=UPI00223B1782|nr:hypothetical protein [Synechococcus sp. CS-1328]MCT0226515.1 hypothetical protein [Synechococcus sp. CS-1328]
MATTIHLTGTPSGADPSPARRQALGLGAAPLLALLLPLGLALQPAGVAAIEAQPGGATAAAAPAATQPAAAQPPATQPAATEPAATKPAATDDSEAPGAREKALLEKIRSLKAPRWRVFGVCRYDWAGWRLAEGNVRTTAVECGSPPVSSSVAVHCDTLKLTRRVGDAAWETWRLPFSRDESTTLGGEDEMMASLCANVTPASTPATLPPAAQPAGDNPAPKSATPQTAAPKTAPPKTTAPTTTAPKSTAPKAAAPKAAATKTAAPKPATAKPASSKPAAP